jgi:hypothetical protein
MPEEYQVGDVVQVIRDDAPINRGRTGIIVDLFEEILGATVTFASVGPVVLSFDDFKKYHEAL